MIMTNSHTYEQQLSVDVNLLQIGTRSRLMNSFTFFFKVIKMAGAFFSLSLLCHTIIISFQTMSHFGFGTVEASLVSDWIIYQDLSKLSIIPIMCVLLPRYYLGWIKIVLPRFDSSQFKVSHLCYFKSIDVSLSDTLGTNLNMKHSNQHNPIPSYLRLSDVMELMPITNFSVAMLHWNKALWLAVKNHMTSFNQSDCIIPV